MQTITFRINGAKTVSHANKAAREINRLMPKAHPLPVHYYFVNADAIAVEEYSAKIRRAGSLANVIGDALVDYSIRSIGWNFIDDLDLAYDQVMGKPQTDR